MWLNKFGIYIIVFFAFIIRLISLNQSLWHDESGNVVYAKLLGFWQYIFQYPIGDFHPNGYFAILWVWGRIFGFSEVSVRIPSVIFGVGTVYISYLIGKELFSKKVGLLAALILSLAPLHIYYSQEARMYSFATFAVSFSFFWLIKLIKKTRFAFLWYSIGITFILYSDYVAYLVIPAQMLYIYIFEKKLSKQMLFAFILGGVIALPTLIILPSQFSYGMVMADQIEGWRRVVGAATLKNYLLLPIKTLIGRISLDNKIIYSVVIALMASPYLFLLIKNQFGFNKKNSCLWFWLVIPVILAIIVSPFTPIFSYFRLLFILPAFYLLVAIAISQLYGKLGNIILGIIVITQLVASSVYLFNTDFHREDWKGSTKFIEENSSVNSVVLFGNNELFTGYRYYNSGKVPAIAAFSKIPAKSLADLIDLKNILRDKRQVFLYEYLVDVTDQGKILEKQLTLLGYEQKEAYDFRGIGFIKVYRCCNISP